LPFFDIKQFRLVIRQIAEEKGINEEKVLEMIDAAIASAYKKDYGKKTQIIRAKLDIETGHVKVWQVKYVVEGQDEEGNVVGFTLKKEEGKDDADNKDQQEDIKIKFNPEKHITLEEAKKIDPKLNVGDELIIPLEERTDFGRIAAQTAKQVIIQRLREAERESIAEEFKGKEGEIVSGIVQRKEGRSVYFDIGRTLGVLLPIEQIRNDNYSIGRRFRLLVLSVEKTTKGPVVLLSRSHPKLLEKLFVIEVPEISSGSVKIRAISREAGSRSKIAVSSEQEGVDPIGSLVGQKGVRVQTIINELSGEKIDIIEWNENPIVFIGNAMSPAKVLNVKILDERKKHALVEVGEDQFSLAIGKRGQNVRLAAKLTGWKIDVRSPKEEMRSEEAEEEISSEEIKEGNKNEAQTDNKEKEENKRLK